MIFRNKSVAIISVAAIVAVTTLLLAVLGAAYYTVERKRGLAALDDELDTTTDQLAASLSLPIWNCDEAVMAKTLEGVFYNSNIYGVIIRANEKTLIRVRDAGWSVIQPEGPFPENGLLDKHKEIVRADRVLGSVRVFGTPKFVEIELKNDLYLIFTIILSVDLILVVSISLFQWHLILKPLRVIERYADSVSVGAEGGKIAAAGFRGELEGLRVSIEKMVDLLAARYAALQRESLRSRESEEQYRMLVESINAGVFQSTVTGTFLQMNKMVPRIAGYDSIEELMPKPANALYPNPADRDRVIERLMRDGEIRDMELQCRKKDGTLCWISLNAVLQRDKAGQPVRIMGVVNDIEERKRVETERLRLEEQFHQMQKMESVGRLAGGVAHDLNNLLSPIIGFSEMLVDESMEKDQIEEAASEILSAGNRARDIVRQLLAFSRKHVLEMRTLDLNLVVEGFGKLLRRIIRENVEIDMRLLRPLPLIRGDVGQLEQVIMNLSVNAQDAMPEGGILKIETGVVDLAAAFADRNDKRMDESTEPEPHVLLCFSDTGLGMDKETQSHLFEPFFTTKEIGKGTGLGLAAVYGIVKQHGGNIWVYSAPGRGTTFKLYFPVSESVVVSDHSEDFVTPAEQTGTETILIVEDNEPARQMVQTVLKRKGYTILGSHNGESALSVLEQYPGPVDLLLTDVIMPGMNGRELYHRAVEKRPGLSVIYMSGYTDDMIGHHGVLEEGVNFLQKPFSTRALVAKVREVLQLRMARDNLGKEVHG